MYIIWCSFLNLTSFDFICVGVALASHIAITSFHKKVLQAAQGNFDVSGACELHRPWTASKRCLSDAAGDTAGRAELRAAPVTAKPGVGRGAADLAAGGRRGFPWDPNNLQ